jgi:hypothetical protein
MNKKTCRICGTSRQTKGKRWAILGDAKMIEVLRGIVYVKVGTKGVHAHLQCIERAQQAKG